MAIHMLDQVDYEYDFYDQKGKVTNVSKKFNN